MTHKKLVLLLLCAASAAYAAENGTTPMQLQNIDAELKQEAVANQDPTNDQRSSSYVAPRTDREQKILDAIRKADPKSPRPSRALTSEQMDGLNRILAGNPQGQEEEKKRAAAQPKPPARDGMAELDHEVATLQLRIQNNPEGLSEWELENERDKLKQLKRMQEWEYYRRFGFGGDAPADHPDSNNKNKQNTQKAIKAAVASRLKKSGTSFSGSVVDENVDKVVAQMIQLEAYRQMRPSFVERVTDTVVEEAAAAVARPITKRIEDGAELVLGSTITFIKKYIWAPCTASKSEREVTKQIEANLETFRKDEQLYLLLQSELLVQAQKEKIAAALEEVKAGEKALAEKEAKAAAHESKKPVVAPAA